ncbi:hypothetical protein PTTG_00758 [Puccinia triticina 1-1 BBBD Race 1]|uniref:GP-PDE domain-containing protein n=2 Tax=Puccinia triticina TaxID=208348 RepID=A0A0C4EJ41_PUCT1|nr:uncharacterized protein PtA15_2A249 [Puccinia triticina]OAV94841.1 hypothetical protein PTTG_00758 [Puccinia triticina 1-1 BBBD Race 1]WAQ81936.1 hypothetical protein PtA15_2A249 [Puccinia triticina]WAR52818.1 hypothetical protein PtB15_2B246 [Puccinia triticina]
MSAPILAHHPREDGLQSAIPTSDTGTIVGNKPSSLPLCWGHRGASASFPENTLCSFEAAIKDGAEGIESDVHVSADDVVLMFHDPSLERTTDGQGLIGSLPYVGGIDGIRTLKAPHQKIPTFDEAMDLLMLKENRHVVFNIDCKPNNDPERLFALIKASIERFEDHALLLSPRLVLGLWHPKFLEPSARLLPALRKAYIGSSPSIARKYFWDACSTFSMKFSCLVGWEGLSFREDCQKAGKSLLVWTVNDRQEMIEACKWGVDAILTDKTADYLALRQQMTDDWTAVTAETSALFPYSSIHYNGLVSWLWGRLDSYSLSRSVGPFSPMTTP